jgi:hypothetical protein
VHVLVLPSLYEPAEHAAHTAEDDGHIPLADVLHVETDENVVQVDAPETLPVPRGQSWHKLTPVNIENFPAAQRLHTPADPYVPAAHPTQVLNMLLSPAGQTAHVDWPIPV